MDRNSHSDSLERTPMSHRLGMSEAKRMLDGNYLWDEAIHFFSPSLPYLTCVPVGNRHSEPAMPPRGRVLAQARVFFRVALR